jgi:hypothetical protein
MLTRDGPGRPLGEGAPAPCMSRAADDPEYHVRALQRERLVEHIEHPQERVGDARVDRRREHHSVHVPVQHPGRRSGAAGDGVAAVRAARRRQARGLGKPETPTGKPAEYRPLVLPSDIIHLSSSRPVSHVQSCTVTKI